MISNDADFLAALKFNFAKIPKPVIFFDVNPSFREQFLSEFDRLEKFSWDTGQPSELAAIYEPNTFLSKDAYKYLIPRVFSFIERNSEDVLYTDFVDCFLSYPKIKEPSEVFCNYTLAQKNLYWRFLSLMDSRLDHTVLDLAENELMRLKAALQIGAAPTN